MPALPPPHPAPRRAARLKQAPGLLALCLLAGAGCDRVGLDAVGVAPGFETHPASLGVAPGEVASFQVSALGRPAPTLQWQRDDGTGWADLAGETAPALTFTAEAAQDGQRFRAVAVNASGSATSHEALLTVQPAPVIGAFTASPAAATASQPFTLHALFSGGTGRVTPGDLAVESGVDLTVTATPPVTFTLTVTGPGGRTSTATASVALATRGGFTATGALQVARAFASATLLPDGRVAIVGGTGEGGAPLDTAELYDPASGTFALAAGRLAHARAHHAAALLADGRVLLAGGEGSPDTAELFDPGSGTFRAAGPMAAPHPEATAVLLDDGRALVVGGASLETYDPAADAFAPAGAGSATRGAAVVRLPGGGVLLAGGAAAAGDQAGTWLERWDPASGQVGTAGALRTPRTGASAVLLADGRVLVAGGDDGTGTAALSAELHDPALPSATPALVALPAPSRQAAAARLAGGDVLLAGDSGGPAAGALLYLPATGAFDPAGSLLRARASATATLLRSGEALVVGGAAPAAEAELFLPRVPAPAPAPSAVLTAPAAAAAGATGLVASVPSQAGARYVWRIRAGSITAGQGTRQITFAAGPTGGVSLDVLVESALGVPAHGRASVPLPPTGAWTRIADGPAVSQPAVAFDPALHRAVAFGGSTALAPATITPSGKTWEWDGGAWTEVTPTGQVPSARAASGMAFDRASGNAVLHGGRATGDAPQTGTFTYRLDTHAWTALADKLGAVGGFAVGYDTDADRVRLFGGNIYSSYYPNVWTWEPATGTWPGVGLSGGITGRSGQRWAYDQARHRFVLFGGRTKAGLLAETWEYDPAASTWTRTATGAGQPPAAEFFGLAYDAARGKVLMYLGAGGGRTWEYDGAGGAWLPVANASQPGALQGATLFYDEDRRAILLVGGTDGAALNGGTWEYLAGP